MSYIQYIAIQTATLLLMIAHISLQPLTLQSSMTSRMRQIANQTLKTVITLFEKLYAKYKQFKLHILVIPLYVYYEYATLPSQCRNRNKAWWQYIYWTFKSSIKKQCNVYFNWWWNVMRSSHISVKLQFSSGHPG